MPNPFPGMNPYLEKPALWQEVHTRFTTYMADALNASLPSPYIASLEKRCYIERPSNSVQPDVSVREAPVFHPPAAPSSVAVLERFTPSLQIEVYAEEIEEVYLSILDMDDDQRIVASIEVLSPTNKTTQNKGRELYLRKQKQVLNSDSHLIEIDLLRAGKHALAVPENALRPQYTFDYAICLHRMEAGSVFEVWLNSVRERLPVIRVPLEEGVPDVALDLQEAFERTYEAGVFGRRLDYTGEAIPPLTGEDATWADTLLREKGLR